MDFIKKYTEFLFEKKKEKESFEDKIEGDGYYKGISTSTEKAVSNGWWWSGCL